MDDNDLDRPVTRRDLELFTKMSKELIIEAIQEERKRAGGRRGSLGCGVQLVERRRGAAPGPGGAPGVRSPQLRRWQQQRQQRRGWHSL
ncbi:hypothetical protein HYH03_001190 [Edaphochlamys debaryana]|uniref:Uncharacterized protein n=1 Tax=Edaphochlamys debaryana TaxID=47281 RepID=A0A835YGM0_9CHLO|nr:hypothetical protein HYH03_001190 [Edaphochlamys debaryana]|eukprot:KAG2501404.1 hypothetical protein HYH03_001190 [Edaphochlamys debaryana]